MSSAQRITVRGAGRGTRVTLVLTEPRGASLIVSQGAAQLAYAFGDFADLRMIEATSGNDWDSPTMWLGCTAVSVPAGSFDLLLKWRAGLTNYRLPDQGANRFQAPVQHKGNADLTAEAAP